MKKFRSFATDSKEQLLGHFWPVGPVDTMGKEVPRTRSLPADVVHAVEALEDLWLRPASVPHCPCTSSARSVAENPLLIWQLY